MRDDFVVVGGGVIGLAVARSLARRGTVTLFDSNRVGREASWAAAGMLSPRSEASSAGALLDLGLSSLALYRSFVDELQAETGIDPEYRADGVLVLARDAEEWHDLERRAEWQRSIGLGVELLDAEDVSSLEPAVGPVTGALFYPEDHQVRPRSLLRALVRSCEIRGVRLVETTRVEGIRTGRGVVTGVRTPARDWDAGTVVVAAGAWTSDVLEDVADWKTHPRKGQMMALGMVGPVIRRVVRWRNFYLVPRNDGELVVGATNEDAGFDRHVTEAAMGSLRRAAETIVPATASLPVRETWTGFRPWIAGDMPRIGPLGVDGLYCATGHYRNGVLWAPATAGILEDYMDGKPVPAYVSELSPRIASPVELSDV